MTAKAPDDERNWLELGAALERENFYARTDSAPQGERSEQRTSPQFDEGHTRLNRIKRMARFRNRK
ncbi:MAG: hypothetical protein GEV05_09835 [Betaproteobacteria bacterium]|nr:hypothetical protein [Betaproteobacteria bacterium]